MKAKKRLWIYACFLFLILWIAAVGSYILPSDPYAQDLERALQPPDTTHWLGTDRYGRDVFARVITGAQTTVFSSLLLLFCISFLGTCAGVISGYYGGKTDTVLMRVSDLFLAFPEMVFAVAVAASFGGGIFNAAMALALVAWPKYARISRGLALEIRSMPYLVTAKMNGSSDRSVMYHHVFPNIAGPVVVTAALDVGTIIMELAGLSFLGLGAMPPTAEWGAMMNNGRSLIQTAPWTVLAPGMAIFYTVAVFNLFGDQLRDVLDPKQKG